MTKILFTLEGKIITPIITSSPILKKGQIWVKIVGDLLINKKPRRSHIGKLIKGERKAPVNQTAYRGFVRLTCVDDNIIRAKVNIMKFLALDCLGSHTNDGFGNIQWLNYREEVYQRITPNPKRKKLKIRKGLGVNYPKMLNRLLTALMLHDFVHTEKHPSKIYQEVSIEDEEIRDACLTHHNGKESKNQLLPILKYYDGLAAYIARRKQVKTISRYDWENGKIDFEQMVKEIETVQNSVSKLYNYIYHSKELIRIVEAMNYGKNGLRNHLLLMANLTINDYYNGKLSITKGKISLSANERGKLKTAKDAERHSFSDRDNADSESPTNSMTEKARSKGREKTSQKKTCRL